MVTGMRVCGKVDHPLGTEIEVISLKQSINQSTFFKHGKWLSKLVFRHAV